MNTESKAGIHSSRQDQTRSYRSSHLGADKARSYDQDLWDPGAAKGLEWLVEQRLLADIVVNVAAGRLCSIADLACGTGRILQFLSSLIPSPPAIDVSPEMLELPPSGGPQAFLLAGALPADPTLAPGPSAPITPFR